MKVVVVSDLHPDAYTAGFPRFDDVDQALAEAVDVGVKTGGLVGFFFLGDLITNDPSLAEYIRCVKMVRKHFEVLLDNGVNVDVIPGNHDVFEDGFGTTAVDLLEFERDGNRVKVHRSPSMKILEDGTRALFIPYPSVKDSYDPVKALRRFAEYVPTGRVSIIATHLMLEGIGPGSETNDYPRGRDVFFPIDLARELFPNAVVVAGHYHGRQTYRGVEVVGSLARLTKGEAGHAPGFLVVDTSRAAQP